MASRVAVLFFVAFVLSTSSVRAADADDPPRPIATAALEVNPLAALVRRFGGQAQIGVAGSVAFVAGASYVLLGESQSYSRYDEITSGLPPVRGWSGEAGVRWFHRFAGAGRASSRYLWLGVSGVHEALEQGPLRQLGPGRDAERDPPATAVSRNGAAVDVGGHVPLGLGLYLVVGIGVVGRVASEPLSKRASSAGLASVFDDLTPAYRERSPVTPRLLLSLGWGR